MNISIGGANIPFMEVAYDFTRSPSAREFDIVQLSGSNARVRYRRDVLDVLTIPFVISRRGSEQFNWDEIKQEIARVAYSDKPEYIGLSGGDSLTIKGFVSSIDFSEEHEYVAKGDITIQPIDALRYSNDIKVDANLSTTKINEGHKSSPWTSRTVFTAKNSEYTLEIKNKGKDLLREKAIITLSYNFVTGDVLEIDYNRRLVTVNGRDITNTVVILKSNFREIPTGEVYFDASDRTEVTYNERYY